MNENIREQSNFASFLTVRPLTRWGAETQSFLFFADIINANVTRIYVNIHDYYDLFGQIMVTMR